MLTVKNEFKKVLFIINKFSGTSVYLPEVEGRIIEACEKNDVECTIEFTQRKGHATELAEEANKSNEYSLVVATGGDGTVNEVASGLLRSPLPMGILPKGSGNGLARHLGIPMNLDRAIDTLFKSRPIDMDTFLLNGKLSVNVSGIGFDGHVANIFGQGKRRGLRGYAQVTMHEFLTFREFEAKIFYNDHAITRKSFVIAIANSSQYGNNARIAPAASICDGVLHICFLKKIPAYRLDFVYAFFKGKIEESSFCEILPGKKIVIELNAPVAYHIDGEAGGVNSRFEIEILPKSLRMLVPPSSLKY